MPRSKQDVIFPLSVEDLRIAEIGDAIAFRQLLFPNNRVSFEFAEVMPVFGDRKALGLPAEGRTGVKDVELALLFNGRAREAPEFPIVGLIRF